MIWVAADLAEGWDIGFEIQLSSASIGVHGDGPFGRPNVANEVWVTDCAANGGARVWEKDI